MGMPGPLELILIFLVLLLIFGAKRIPEIARGVGKGIREFKDATSEISRELNMEDSSQNRIHSPRQGTTTPRSGASQQQTQQAQPQPQQANNPGSAEASQQQAS